ncbi:MAG: tryptophan--tRNA ligase [Myxococcales bacterium]|nr:tryptophan--tRNA ligase [Myxococcales bacterium]
MTRKRSLSGIKPTGTPHLGNYFGMIEPAVALQETHDPFYFVADYHALTTGRDPARLRQASHEVAATLLAAGLDPARATLFRQSDVPEVQELAWHLACVTGVGLLLRAHAYKDAEAKGAANELSMGTFNYPVLMAADILLYDSDVVPVGKDQLQHIEMAQDMAGHLNALYGNCLRRPEAFVRPEVATIVGTDGRKMSKSYNNTIEIYLPPKKLRQAVMGIKTDSKGVDEPKDPEGDNVFTLYKVVAPADKVAEMAARYREGQGYGYGHAKQALYEALEALVGPQRERYAALLARPSELEDVLQAGAVRARAVARAVLDRVRDRVGLPPLPR